MYVNDYNDMEILRTLTSRYDIAIILVTHTRKADDPDPLNTISGSTGLMGAVDGVFILEKQARISSMAKLIGIGRDTEGFVFAVDFDADNCRWVLVEDETDEQAESDLLPMLTELLGEKDSWMGTATDMCEFALKRDKECRYKPYTIVKQIKKEQRDLDRRYGIKFKFEKKGNIKTITVSKN